MIDEIAQWVEVLRNDADLYLLGPNLTLLKAQNVEEGKIGADALSFLAKNNFLRGTASETVAQDKRKCAHIRIDDMVLAVTSDRYPEAVSRLECAFAQFNSECAREKLAQPPAVTLNLDYREPLDGGSPVTVFPQLLFGESEEGFHIGPLISSNADWDVYARASRDWSSVNELRALGFTHLPSRFGDIIQRDAVQAANAIREVLRRGSHWCKLIEGARYVALRPTGTDNCIDYRDLSDTYGWSKGLVRQLSCQEFSGVPSAFVATCAFPAKAIAFLEGNSGSGLSRTEASFKCLAEGVERYSALCANHAARTPDKKSRNMEKLTLSSFHATDRDLQHESAHNGRLTTAFDEISETEFSIPECMVPFPYLPVDDGIGFHASTAGLATHSTRHAAIVNGTLELFERENLYKNLLHLRTAQRISVESLIDVLPDLSQMLHEVETNGVMPYLVSYADESKIPIVHCFLDDQISGFVSRGTGSGGSEVVASRKAILEALMLREHFLALTRESNRDSNDPQEMAYYNWAEPATRRLLINYLRESSVRDVKTEECEPLSLAVHYLATRALPLLVTDLPCIIKGWSAVRVLIPTFTTHQVASSCEAGEKLAGATFTKGIPV